jgi:DNA-binding winged helix-turn-helix (wHTH) protein
MQPGEPKRLFRFGVYEVDEASGELRKSGVRIRLQEQPFQALILLIERPAEVVTRDELRQRLWGGDTFVDFDHGLNTVMNKLREVLGDSASKPRYIETLAKRGYRFVYPVEVVNGQASVSPAVSTSTVDSPAQAEASSTSLLTHPDELPKVPSGRVRVLFSLIQVMYLSFYIVALARLGQVEELLDQVFGHSGWIVAVLVVTAVIGIPIRLYLLAAVLFDMKDLGHKFRRMFAATFVLDELWALAPFLLAPQIGIGLALAATAAILYLPFAQRTLALMRDHSASRG